MHRPARVLEPRPSTTREKLFPTSKTSTVASGGKHSTSEQREIDVEESLDVRLLTFTIDALVLIATLTIELIV